MIPTQQKIKSSSYFSLFKNVPFERGENIDAREDKAMNQEYLREMVLNLILKCVLVMG